MRQRIGRKSICFIITILFCCTLHAIAEESFDVRHHLSTVTRYDAVKDILDNTFSPTPVPDECTPIHINLVARHGTRAPTKKRIKELDNLAIRLKLLLQNGESGKKSLEKIPAWVHDWQSPWVGKVKGGELISEGEDELYNFGVRIRERFPELFNEDYHPDVHVMKSSQIPRASASAVAFGMGLFSGKGKLGPGNHRAFAVISESRASDVQLRFHDCCQNYKTLRKSKQPEVQKLKYPILDDITAALRNRYGLNFTRQDTSSIWFLCKEEASLLNITNQACGMFTSSEVKLLEWTDDLEMFILKGYGNATNYRMGLPLLNDVIQSMEQAIKDKEEARAPGSYEKARLRFAHAETLVPFSCLMGLFLKRSDLEKLLREESLPFPPKPPQKRIWKGSMVAPFAGNNIIVLFSCPKKTSSQYFVKVLHNEKPIPLPGCDNSDFCPFEVFKEKIVAPHLKYDYNSICDKEIEVGENLSLAGKLAKWFGWHSSASNVSPKEEF
ncbi:multiple inositol polyphosphate phosphatase 1 isoform X1 [Impatiens glandulifera]|uniref:multiple inositol polyphosphate phosphatase 1 isoform X1 n=1 Tax=Impatiens glandulifera TaxID=253017 RepID=UPI001FB1689D|nr:multiple inositol polyphosphate phosphatase 1 isoform X1 [Impatiens glandulifera]